MPFLSAADEKARATLKLTTTTQVSVDGVMQGPGGPDEDERGVFELGGWAPEDGHARDTEVLDRCRDG
jgi:hypothetical protein